MADRPPSYDQQIIDYLSQHGCLGTWVVACKIGINTARTRRILRRMERDGLVYQHPRYSSVNNISWAVVQQGASS